MEHLRQIIPVIAVSNKPAQEYHENVVLLTQDEMLAIVLPFLDEDNFSRGGFTRLMIEYGYKLHFRESDSSLCWMIEPDIGIP